MSIEIFSGSEKLIKLELRCYGGNQITIFIFKNCEEPNEKRPKFA